jgi:hypothetical protein
MANNRLPMSGGGTLDSRQAPGVRAGRAPSIDEIASFTQF